MSALSFSRIQTGRSPTRSLGVPCSSCSWRRKVGSRMTRGGRHGSSSRRRKWAPESRASETRRAHRSQRTDHRTFPTHRREECQLHDFTVPGELLNALPGPVYSNRDLRLREHPTSGKCLHPTSSPKKKHAGSTRLQLPSSRPLAGSLVARERPDGRLTNEA